MRSTKKVTWIFILYILAAPVAACSSIKVFPSTPSIDQMEKIWQDHKVDSYRIEVLVVDSIWHAQSHQITIRNNQIVNSNGSCVPAPMEAGKCEVEAFNAEDYTVPGLFAKAHAQAKNQQSTWLVIAYDPIYGFPSEISFDNPEMTDEDWVWRVTTFEVLE